MQTTVVLKYLRILAWIAPFVIIMGVSAGSISGNWGVVPLALIGAGIFILIVYVILIAFGAPGFWGRRSTQLGANVLVATLSVVLILGLVNFMGFRYAHRIDLTENQLFTLAPQTQQVLAGLKKPLKVWVFANPSDRAVVNARALLNQYRQQSNLFSFEIIDPQAKPTLARQFKVNNPGEVHLEMGDRNRLLQTVNQFESLSEARLTAGIESITNDRQTKVYFLQGHNELPLDQAANGLAVVTTRLNEKNFVSEPLNLSASTEIPKDAAVLVIAGPQRPLLDKEVEAIETYLNQGGSVMALIDPTVKTGLEDLLKAWGVKLDDRLVINASQQQLLGPSTPVISEYGSHPITKDFGNGFSAYYLARPLELTPVTDVQETPLLFTNAQNWAETDLNNPELEFNPEKGDVKGPLTIGVALSRPVQVSSGEKTDQAASEKVDPSAEKVTDQENTAQPDEKVGESGKASEPAPEKDSTDQAAESSGEQPTSPSPAPESPTLEASPSPDTEASPTSSSSPAAAPDSPTPDQKTSPSPSPAGQSTSPEPKKPEPKKAEARLVVVGNSSFASDQFAEQPQLLNSDVFLNSVTWLSKQDDRPLSIRPKENKNRGLSLTSIQANLVGWMALVILPLIGFGSAFWVWWQRR